MRCLLKRSTSIFTYFSETACYGLLLKWNSEWSLTLQLAQCDSEKTSRNAITSGVSSIFPLQNLQKRFHFSLHYSFTAETFYAITVTKHTQTVCPTWIRGLKMTQNNRCFASAFLALKMRVLGKKWKRFSLNAFHSTYIWNRCHFFLKSFTVYVNLNELKEPENA